MTPGKAKRALFPGLAKPCGLFTSYAVHVKARTHTLVDREGGGRVEEVLRHGPGELACLLSGPRGGK